MSECAECNTSEVKEYRLNEGPREPRESSVFDLAALFRERGPSFMERFFTSPQQKKALRDMAACRTVALGGHVDHCQSCGHRCYTYNSCRNRHCPTCQGASQQRWIAGRLERVLPTHYFHVVFTLPAELRLLAKENPAAVYDLFLRSASAALLDLGRDPERLGAELGVTVVLHTWNRDLTLHPHVHCIVTGGGLSLDGQRWVKTSPRYLFPHKVLAALFRGKVLDGLGLLWGAGALNLRHPNLAPFAGPAKWNDLQHRLRHKPWVVHAKRPFAGPAQVITYLGQYTHRVAISNRRILEIDAHHVRFRTRGDKEVTLSTDDFIRRFLLHILPLGFVKIRHAGLHASRHVDTHLAKARALLTKAIPQPPEPHDDASPQPQTASSDSPVLPQKPELRCEHCGSTAVTRTRFHRGQHPPSRDGP